MAAKPYTRDDLQQEAEEALARLWFIQRAEVYSRTETTFAVRLFIRPDLFVPRRAGSNPVVQFRPAESPGTQTQQGRNCHGAFRDRLQIQG